MQILEASCNGTSAAANIPMNPTESKEKASNCLWKIVNRFFSAIEACFKRIFCCFFKDKKISSTSPNSNLSSNIPLQRELVSLFEVSSPAEIKKLLAAGASPLQTNDKGWTPSQQLGRLYLMRGYDHPDKAQSRALEKSLGLLLIKELELLRNQSAQEYCEQQFKAVWDTVPESPAKQKFRELAESLNLDASPDFTGSTTNYYFYIILCSIQTFVRSEKKISSPASLFNINTPEHVEEFLTNGENPLKQI